MPKLIDYGVRFELMREAVVRLAAREGAAAVTLARVATEMNVSSHTLRRALARADALPVLGLGLIERQRRHRWLTTPGPRRIGSPALSRANATLALELPLNPARIEETRAWTALTTAFGGEAVARKEPPTRHTSTRWRRVSSPCSMSTKSDGLSRPCGSGHWSAASQRRGAAAGSTLRRSSRRCDSISTIWSRPALTM